MNSYLSERKLWKIANISRWFENFCNRVYSTSIYGDLVDKFKRTVGKTRFFSFKKLIVDNDMTFISIRLSACQS